MIGQTISHYRIVEKLGGDIGYFRFARRSGTITRLRNVALIVFLVHSVPKPRVAK